GRWKVPPRTRRHDVGVSRGTRQHGRRYADARPRGRTAVRLREGSRHDHPPGARRGVRVPERAVTGARRLPADPRAGISVGLLPEPSAEPATTATTAAAPPYPNPNP